MRKVKALSLTFLLVLMFVLSSCGEQSSDILSTGDETTLSGDFSANETSNTPGGMTGLAEDVTAEAAADPEGTVESTNEEADNSGNIMEETDDTVDLLHPYIYDVRVDYTYETVSGFLYAYAISASPLLDEKEAQRYPKLDESLREDYENDLKEARETLKTLSTDGKNTLDVSSVTDLNFMYYSYYKASVLRSDEVVLSVDKHLEYDDGAAHWDHGDYAVNYDPTTGEVISIYDVTGDTSALTYALKIKLNEKYSDLNLLEEDVDNCLKEFYLAQQTGETYRALTFGIGYEGVTFYFNTYSIGPYSNGTQQITLTYAEYPDLFSEKYVKRPDNYISNVTNLDHIPVDLDGDGKVNDVSVTPSFAEDLLDANYYNTLTISVDGNEKSFDSYFFSAEVYLMKKEDSFYLYTFTHEDNDIVTNEVYDISGGTIVKADYALDLTPTVIVPSSNSDDETGQNEYIEIQMPLIDPAKMIFSSLLDMLGTYSASRTYTVGENGIPESKELFILDSERVLTTLQNLEITGVDANGNETGEVISISNGSQVSIYATDGETFVILSLGDERYGKVIFDKSSYPYTVNGTPEDEVFSGMMYAA